MEYLGEYSGFYEFFYGDLFGADGLVDEARGVSEAGYTELLLGVKFWDQLCEGDR